MSKLFIVGRNHTKMLDKQAFCNEKLLNQVVSTLHIPRNHQPAKP